MNTLNRPLFRQMGGPAAMMPQDMAPPMPQDMAPPMPQDMAMAPSPEEQVMGVEQSAEEAGREYVASMMGGIDSAEDVAGMINALRGNDAPLESRYAELAGYVGEADASQTPESVLAMVQPTLMMTEEGAVDSGIGELMAGLSDSPMETPSGDPTAMGQGVGELMTMGAGSTPPVNFRNGGPVEVRGYAGQETDSSEVRQGGGSDLAQRAQKLYPGMQELYSSVLGSPEARAADLEEQKRLSKAQIFFDIAQTALAAGAPTATPMSAAERIAGAIGQTQLFDKMGQRSAGLLQAKQAQAAEDRQMRMAALTGSIGESTRQLGEEAKESLAGVNATLRMKEVLATQTYTSGENALDRTGRLKLANNQIAANIALQKSGAANTIAEIDARGELQEALQKSQAGFTASLQNDRFTFERGQDLNNNAHQIFLQQRQAENQKKIEALRFDNSKESAELQNRFVQENYKIQSELQLASRLEEMGASNAYDIGKMAKGQEYSIALQGNLSALQDIGREDAQAHDLAKQALAVAASKQEKLTTFAAQTALQKIAQNFAGTESEKARALSKAKMMIDNAFRTEQLQISQGQLDVSEGQLDLGRMSLAVTESYNAGKLAVDRAEAEAKRLGNVFGTGKEGLTMGIVSNESFLIKYANNTLNKDTDGISIAEMETALGAYNLPGEYDPATKKSMPGQPFNDAQIRALQSRVAAGLSTPTGVKFPAETVDSVDPVDSVEAEVIKKLELDTSPNNIPLAEQLSMGDEAFGSKAFLFNLLNIGLEVVQLPAVFDETKSASDAVKSLNQQFETVFLAAQNIRDSVFQGKKLEALTPDPLKFWMGPDAARSKALILYERLNGEIERMENSLDDPEIFLKQTGTEDSVGTKLQRLPVLKDLRDGYGLLAQIDLAARGLDPDILKQNQQEKTLLDELDAASGVKN